MNTFENISYQDFFKLKQQSKQILKAKVMSDSMEPVISIDDLIIIDTNIDQIKQYDIIVLWDKASQKLLCHVLNHIYFTSNNSINTYQTIGLKNRHHDLILTQEEILGKVINYQLRFRDIFQIWLKNKLK